MQTKSKIAVLGMIILSFAYSGQLTAQVMKEKNSNGRWSTYVPI